MLSIEGPIFPLQLFIPYARIAVGMFHIFDGRLIVRILQPWHFFEKPSLHSDDDVKTYENFKETELFLKQR